ncbi:spore cortex-lytic enzyme [Acetivibrio straminisolvens]|uniref:Spore cortex-lytic enzyme n=1 Tax=Acetivibrio straminisolvens JCM 21531 TaxID=1294263 RepID=W4VB88_9FIRM|nr:spore cortex-lytic enzyme [Acetivibrio straminisolvens]GAE90009.1 spore cortex-lytic enzyme [Acetivibrio straminisolvens JCM 21531]
MRKRILLVIAAITILSILSASITFREELSNLYGYSRAALSYYGSTGQEVKNIQYKLAIWKYYDGKIDGIYGYKTYTAVRKFQAKNGLKVDGIAGPETLAALGLPTGQATKTTSAKPSGNRNLDLLAHLVYGEARGEPYIGQVAVAAVVLNRTRDSRFPNTIAGVIYQPGAFDAVADGQINLAPNETAYKAAKDALNGWDPSGGAVYYYNPRTATSKWIWSRKIVKVIGKHNFAI